MLTRKMLLALGKDRAEEIEGVVAQAQEETQLNAAERIASLAERGMEISGGDLMALVDTGKKLSTLDTAAQRMDYFIENFDTKGVNPDDRPRRRAKRREDEEDNGTTATAYRHY